MRLKVNNIKCAFIIHFALNQTACQHSQLFLRAKFDRRAIVIKNFADGLGWIFHNINIGICIMTDTIDLEIESVKL